MISSTTDQQLTGDGQDEVLESFSKCKHMDQNIDSKYVHVKHQCKYSDMYGRCTRDTCYYDADESPDVCNKHWFTCVFCGKTMSIDPKQVSIPVCDECLSLFNQCLRLPFTCMKCGAVQGSHSKILFSRLCDDCVDTLLFNDCCKHWALDHEAGTAGYDLP
jgi:hypothetical protein